VAGSVALQTDSRFLNGSTPFRNDNKVNSSKSRRRLILPERRNPLPHLVIPTEERNLLVAGSVALQTDSRFLNGSTPFRNDNEMRVTQDSAFAEAAPIRGLQHAYPLSNACFFSNSSIAA